MRQSALQCFGSTQTLLCCNGGLKHCKQFPVNYPQPPSKLHRITATLSMGVHPLVSSMCFRCQPFEIGQLVLSSGPAVPGIQLLQQMGDVETAYNLTPEQLEERVATADALIIRSATQARRATLLLSEPLPAVHACLEYVRQPPEQLAIEQCSPADPPTQLA